MFNPINLDEICFQANLIESRGKNDYENFPKKPIQPVVGKRKGKNNRYNEGRI